MDMLITTTNTALVSMACFQDNLGKLKSVPECQPIVNFSAAR